MKIIKVPWYYVASLVIVSQSLFAGVDTKKACENARFARNHYISLGYQVPKNIKLIFNRCVYEPKQVSLKYVAILQLATHDLFDIDRGDKVDPNTAVEHEDGKLNLSTVLNIEQQSIRDGGDFRNAQNSSIKAIATELGALYLDNCRNNGLGLPLPPFPPGPPPVSQEQCLPGIKTDRAYAKVLRRYHEMVKEAYEITFDEPFPERKFGKTTHDENLALRTTHDLIPGKITVDGVDDQSFIHDIPVIPLSKKDLKQLGSPLDGVYDPELLDINVNFGGFVLQVNLLAADIDFATQFSTDHSFEEYLDELVDGRYDADEEVTKAIRSLFAKGMNFRVEAPTQP